MADAPCAPPCGLHDHRVRPTEPADYSCPTSVGHLRAPRASLVRSHRPSPRPTSRARRRARPGRGCRPPAPRRGAVCRRRHARRPRSPIRVAGGSSSARGSYVHMIDLEPSDRVGRYSGHAPLQPTSLDPNQHQSDSHEARERNRRQPERRREHVMPPASLPTAAEHGDRVAFVHSRKFVLRRRTPVPETPAPAPETDLSSTSPRVVCLGAGAADRYMSPDFSAWTWVISVLPDSLGLVARW